MNGVTTFLNSAGESFVGFALAMLIQSSVLIITLLGLDLILRRRVRAVFRYWIWMLVLAKLVLPTTLSSPTGPAYWFGDRLPAVVPDKSVAAAEPGEIVLPFEPMIALPAESDIHAEAPAAADVDSHTRQAATKTSGGAAVAITWQGFVFLAWLATVTAAMLLLMQRMFFVRGLIAQSKDASTAMIDMFDQCCRQMAVHKGIPLRLSALAASPSVCGLFRPKVLIPEDLTSELDSQHVKSILLHELAHIKRSDLWVSLIQTLLQIVYIYNPLLWVANAVIRKTREQAVDEMVLVAMGAEAEQYPQTLLAVSKLTFGRPALSLRLIGVVESKKVLSSRIRHITSRPFPKSTKLGIVGLTALVFIAALLLPMARAQRLSSANTGTDAEQTEQYDPKASHLTYNGKVVDADGKPVAGATAVAFEMAFDKDKIFRPRPLGKVVTKADGRFSFKRRRRKIKDSPRGAIAAFRPAFAVGWAGWERSIDWRSPITRNVTVVLGKPDKLAGLLMDEDGKPVAGAGISAILYPRASSRDQQQTWLAGVEPVEWLLAKSDERGRFQFDNIPAETKVDLMVSARGKATVFTYEQDKGPRFAAGQTDIKITTVPEARIEGTIIDKSTQTGIPKVKITARLEQPMNIFDIFQCLSREDSSFSLGGLSSGRYLLTGDIFPEIDIGAQSGQTNRIKTIECHAMLQGRVTRPNGEPIANVNVAMRSKPEPGLGRSPGQVQMPGPRYYAGAETNEQGHYRCFGLPADVPYRVFFSLQQELPWAQGYRYYYAMLPNTFEGPQTVDYQVPALLTGTARLTVQVTDQHGQPLDEFASLQLQKERSDEEIAKGVPKQGLAIRLGRDERTFEFKNLPAGEYRLGASSPPRYIRRDRQYFTLVEGQTASVTAKLTRKEPKKTTFYGRVLYEDGKPAVPELPPSWLRRSSVKVVRIINNQKKYPSFKVDNQGYFTAELEEDDWEHFRSGAGKLQIYHPYFAEKAWTTIEVGTFAHELLAKDKSSAGTVKIKRIVSGPSSLGEKPTP
jgi:beta-lactamase regulating signal transducer with metallopeptidase domain